MLRASEWVSHRRPWGKMRPAQGLANKGIALWINMGSPLSAWFAGSTWEAMETPPCPDGATVELGRAAGATPAGDLMRG